MKLVFLVALLAIAASGCDRFYSVHGHILDCSDNAPIGGADVSLSHVGYPRAGEVVTADDGTFDVAIEPPDDDQASTLTVNRTGFETLTTEVKPLETAGDQDFCLEPTVP